MGNLVERVHAIVLAGGSAYGLDAASGVMRWLEEHEAGFLVTNAVVPIVPAACIFDFSIGRADVRPDAE
jgi:L-aminopeptidase/D-esterase-like protein